VGEFDKGRLATQVVRLSRRLRVAFAAACAQRLYLPYAPYEERVGPGEAGELSGLLDELWSKCESNESAVEWAEQSVRRLEEIIPPDDDVRWLLPGHSEARHFSVAVLYAIESCRRGDVDTPVAAADYAFGVPWSIVVNRERVDLNLPESEAAVLGHLLVQAELGRQDRDMQELLLGPDRAELVRRLRDRARRERQPSK
jgi:hypothetical protein